MSDDVIGIITGSGINQFSLIDIKFSKNVNTPYGKPSSSLLFGSIAGMSVVVLQRHGPSHTIAPHHINYRANLSALSEAGARHIISIAAVGGIRADCSPGTLVVPDQLIDYTFGREQSYHDGISMPLGHCEMTAPFCEQLRQLIVKTASAAGISLVADGCYGVTQGPRLETAAEIQRLKRDGNDIIGMTAMPEAGLAAELGLCYASLALVVNWAAGLGSEPLNQQLVNNDQSSVLAIEQILLELIPQLPGLAYQAVPLITV